VSLTVSASADLPSRTLTAVDGDTVRAGTVTYRLLGYDTPETIFAKCPAERMLGLKAKERLQELISTSENVRLLVNWRRKDRYGRGLARLMINGRDIADIMVGEGYARRYDGRTKRKGWCS
jgi:endonuclease YncB( thermonuclease family)